MRTENLGIEDRLKTLQMGQTVEDFAKRCGVPESTLRNYLSGQRFPDPKQLAILADNLQISLDWLVSGKMIGGENFLDEQIEQLCRYDPHVIETVSSEGSATPVVRTYDDEKSHLHFFCIHCNCWHLHGRGGKEYPYTEGRGGMAGHRHAHCFATNSPFWRNGIILDVVGKLKDLKNKQKSRISHVCPDCLRYNSAAFYTCQCGSRKDRAKTLFPEMADLYQQISIYTGDRSTHTTTLPAPTPTTPPAGGIHAFYAALEQWARETGQSDNTQWLHNQIKALFPAFKAWFDRGGGGTIS